MIGARRLYFVEKTTVEYNGFSSGSKNANLEIKTLAIFDTIEKAEKYLEHHGHKEGVAEMDYGITEVYNIKFHFVDIDI